VKRAEEIISPALLRIDRPFGRCAPASRLFIAGPTVTDIHPGEARVGLVRLEAARALIAEVASRLKHWHGAAVQVPVDASAFCVSRSARGVLGCIALGSSAMPPIIPGHANASMPIRAAMTISAIIMLTAADNPTDYAGLIYQPDSTCT